VPIYGDAPVIGRSFALAQLKIYIPTQDLGKPWDKTKGKETACLPENRSIGRGKSC
jgi:hypothetical protein